MAATPAVVLDAGEAWFEDGLLRAADEEAEGAVRGAFGRAAYLRVGGHILALCSRDVASGPLHLRIDPFPTLTVGQAVRLGAGRLAVGGVRVAVSPQHRWAPEPLPRDALRPARERPPGAWPPGEATGLPAGLVAGAARLVEADDLTGLARLVGGRGPGLTPAGDDLLAGVLVAHAVLHPEAEPRRREAAVAARTTDVAAAFLWWAARGRCIQPVHDVLVAMAAGRSADMTTGRDRLARVGASSGAALLLGLDLTLI